PAQPIATSVSFDSPPTTEISTLSLHDALPICLRGSVQHLPNDNVFVGWSERGYMSEHSPEGKTLMQASFASTRFSSYRSYKYPLDRKSTRLNSSHVSISYAVFCLKKKRKYLNE